VFGCRDIRTHHRQVAGVVDKITEAGTHEHVNRRLHGRQRERDQTNRRRDRPVVQHAAELDAVDTFPVGVQNAPQ
jgi:hypothetical protein